jgi:hypothetical protein
LENPVKNKLVSFVELPGETADIISTQVMKAIDNYDLETKEVGLSADNTNTNYGGFPRRGKENVLIEINFQLNRNIIGFGCSAHIIHNCTKTAFDSVPVNNEVLVTKIFGYFHIGTVRVEGLHISVTSQEKSVSKYWVIQM